MFAFNFQDGICTIFRGDVEIDSCYFEGKNAAEEAAAWSENRAVDFGWNPEEGEELMQK